MRDPGQGFGERQSQPQIPKTGDITKKLAVPLISVLLPIRNGARHLDACLKSLESQTFQNFEIIAVDHASDDATPQILKAFAAHDPRLRMISSRASSLPMALNEGLAECQGEFVARMDADDECLPQRFARQLALLEGSAGIGLAGARVEIFGDGELSEGYQNYESWVNALATPEAILRELFIECPLPHPTFMARREWFQRLGYRDDGMPEDYHFVLRAAELGLGMAKPEGVLLRWRERATRHSRLDPRYSRPAFMALRARYLKKLVIKDSPCLLWGAGNRGRLLARLLWDEGASIKNVVGWSPGESQPTSVHGVEVIPPEALGQALPGPLIACVGEPGARDEIRAWAAKKNWAEGRDYWFAS